MTEALAMTDALRDVVGRMARLPAREQDGLAHLIAAELATMQIEEEFERGERDVSPELAAMIEEARKEHAEGRTRPLEELLG